ncbi:DUF6580 family putative transport protein [Rhodopirellula sp. JC639]|uniref:DUF6580 family putative transport protein n=1 Tax=Stieleria mannarensis TaxID=2755585 RepID=UPI0016031C33|nr:DUF6580 family putative transport protein [Rhodopirellula sp. JC639]
MIYLLTLAIAATRFLPHPPNFACLGALGLFAGCYFAGRKAYLVPAAALLISDAVSHLMGTPGMGFYNPMVMAATYLGVTLAVPLGRLVRSRASANVNWRRLPAGALAASTLFFVVSNFGVWLGPWYPATAQGLIACFTNAIPFYGYTLAGDLCFVAVMFGAYELSGAKRSTLAPAVAHTA